MFGLITKTKNQVEALMINSKCGMKYTKGLNDVIIYDTEATEKSVADVCKAIDGIDFESIIYQKMEEKDPFKIYGKSLNFLREAISTKFERYFEVDKIINSFNLLLSKCAEEAKKNFNQQDFNNIISREEITVGIPIAKLLRGDFENNAIVLLESYVNKDDKANVPENKIYKEMVENTSDKGFVYNYVIPYKVLALMDTFNNFENGFKDERYLSNFMTNIDNILNRHKIGHVNVSVEKEDSGISINGDDKKYFDVKVIFNVDTKENKEEILTLIKDKMSLMERYNKDLADLHVDLDGETFKKLNEELEKISLLSKNKEVTGGNPDAALYGNKEKVIETIKSLNNQDVDGKQAKPKI